MKGMRETKMRIIRFKLLGMVLKTKRELVLEKESTMRLKTMLNK